MRALPILIGGLIVGIMIVAASIAIDSEDNVLYKLEYLHGYGHWRSADEPNVFETKAGCEAEGLKRYGFGIPYQCVPLETK